MSIKLTFENPDLPGHRVTVENPSSETNTEAKDFYDACRDLMRGAGFAEKTVEEFFD